MRAMISNWFKSKRANPRSSLVVFGTDFGSYQFLQLVQTSSVYEIVGFISTDPWQQRSGFGKIGVIYPTELKSFCEKHAVVAIIVPSDQREHFENNADMQLVRDCDKLIKHCEVLAIPLVSSKRAADEFIDQLI